jgi:single-strand DNA-binding protein
LGNVGKEGLQERSVTTKAGKEMARASFTMATNKGWFDTVSKVWKNSVEWHTVVLWGKQVESVRKAGLEKGCRVLVEGSLKTREWVGDDGKKNRITEIQMLDLIVLTGGSGSGEMDQDGEPGDVVDEDNLPF